MVARRGARRRRRRDPRPRHDRLGRRTPHLRRGRRALARAGRVPRRPRLRCVPRATRPAALGVRARIASPCSMYNRPEHVETILGCWKARVVPCNVNYHYTAGEVAELLHRIGARGVVYDRRLADKLGGIADRPRPPDRDGRRPQSHRADPGAVHYEPRSSPAPPWRTPPTRHPTTSTSRAPAARPDARRPCCGDRATSSSPGMGGTDDLDDAALRTRALGRRGRLVSDVAADARRRGVDHVPGRPTWAPPWCSTTTREPSTCARSSRPRRASA